MAITAETRNDIIELVVTAYNAAPGTTLLTELVAIVDGGGTLADVANELTTSARWNSLYPSFQTSEEFANEWLGALVPEASAAAMAEGVAIAVGLLNGGASFADLVIEAQTFLSTASENDASFGTSVANFNNKVEVATNYTVTLEKDGTADELANVLASVTSNDATVATAIADGANSTTGTISNLTTKIDSIVGTTDNDEVNAIFSDAAIAGETFNISDTIDLGAGDADTLNVNFITAADIERIGGSAENVEIVNIRSTDSEFAGNTATFTMSRISGETQVWVRDNTVIGDNDDTIVVTGVTDGATLGLANNDSDLDVSFTTSGNSTSADSVTVAAGGGSTGDVTINDGAGDGYGTVNIVTSGSKTSLASFTAGTDFNSVVVTGDQALSFGSALSQVTSYDASAATGAQSVRLSAGAKLDAKGGSAADSLTLDVASAATKGMSVDGFETVSLVVHTSSTIDWGSISGASVLASVHGNGADVLTLKGASESPVFVFSGGGASKSAAHSGLTLELKDDEGSSDSATLNVSNLGKTDGKIDSTIGAVTIAGKVENLTISGADYDNVTFAAVTAESAKTVKLMGSVDFDLGNASLMALEMLDASDSTGDLTLGDVQATAQNSTITTGSGKDSVQNSVVAAEKAQTISTGDGDDTIRIVDTAAANGAVIANLGAGEDTISLNTADVTTGAQRVDGGADEDLIEAHGAFSFKLAQLANVEKINFLSGASKLSFGAANGYAESVIVTDVANADVTININPVVDGSVSVANYKMLGWTDGVDILCITSNTGDETIMLGSEAGTENVVFKEGTFGDTISGFEAGAGGDILNLTVTAVEAMASGENDLVVAGSAISINDGLAPTFASVADTLDLGTVAGGIILAVTGTYGDTTDLETALEAGGDRALTAGADFAANDMILAAYSDGANSYIAVVTTTAGAADDANFAADDLTVTNLITLSGITDVTALHADNIDFI